MYIETLKLIATSPRRRPSHRLHRGLGALLRRLADLASAPGAEATQDEIWRLWMTYPDARAAAELERATRAILASPPPRLRRGRAQAGHALLHAATRRRERARLPPCARARAAPLRRDALVRRALHRQRARRRRSVRPRYRAPAQSAPRGESEGARCAARRASPAPALAGEHAPERLVEEVEHSVDLGARGRQRRHEAERLGPRRVDQQPALARRVDDLRARLAAEVERDEKPAAPYLAEAVLRCKLLQPACELAPALRDTVEKPRRQQGFHHRAADRGHEIGRASC